MKKWLPWWPVSVVAIISCSILFLLLFAVGCKEVSSQENERFSNAQRIVCQEAGLEEPVWRRCSGSYRCFYCADAKGRLYPVKVPDDACGYAYPKAASGVRGCDVGLGSRD